MFHEALHLQWFIIIVGTLFIWALSKYRTRNNIENIELLFLLLQMGYGFC